MSTTAHPSRVGKTAPKEADITSGTSTQSSENFVVAAKIARVPKCSSEHSGKEGQGTHPQQLPLMFEPPPTSSPPRSQSIQKPRPPTAAAIERFASLDQRMTTTDVLRVVGVNRSTLFRWVKRGTFPQRHASGGWLRSDVERWLAEKMDASR
jgi:predicted DNA-binding transcriptional regulator AlpA